MSIYLAYSRLCIIFAENFDAKVVKLFQICKYMADFYVNYGSKGAKLICNYKCGNVNIRLHTFEDVLYILSKNRKIVFKTMATDKAISAFHNLIYMEAPDLFNF